MITIILEKVLAELNSDAPRLDYIRGMVEVLLASQPKAPSVVVKSQPVTLGDEGAMMDAKARAALETIKALGGTEIT